MLSIVPICLHCSDIYLMSFIKLNIFTCIIYERILVARTATSTLYLLLFSFYQLSIKTRSVGTNTQEAERAIESNYMEPCQPGTSVNLEGIVWHETEEGKDNT